MSSPDGAIGFRRRPRPRLESLSDLIYGLSLSIGAISLVITNGQGATPDDINRNIFEFILVFLVLITSWMIYTTDMSVLPTETRLITLLNVILLVLVAIIPYLFDQVVSTTNTPLAQEYASTLFTVDLAGSLVILVAFAHIIALEEKQLVEKDVQLRFRRARDRMIILTIVVLASLLIPWNWMVQFLHARLLFWYVPVASFWYNRMTSKPLGRSQVPGQ